MSEKTASAGPDVEAPPARTRARAWPRTTITRNHRRLLVGLLVVLVGLVGGWLGLLLAGDVNARVGPLHTQLSAEPGWSGGTTVDVAPLGSLWLDTHHGPLAVGVRVERLDPAATKRIVANPGELAGLGSEVSADLRHAVTRLAIQVVLSATAGAVVLGLLVLRKWRRVVASGATALAVVVGSLGMGYLTWNPAAVTTPRYTGLLSAAPSLVGSAQSITSNFAKYRDELGKLVTNVSSLYDVTSRLRPYNPPDDTIRLLHVSDIHLNPAAFNIITSLISQFKINAVVDTGDLTDHGTAAESRSMALLAAGVGVPYVYIRGNHDSMATQQEMAAQRNVVVLDDQVGTVAGVRFAGIGDPRFTPDKNTRDDADTGAMSRAAGAQLADLIKGQTQPVDIALVHDPVAAEPLAGTVPLVLAGHTHKRDTHRLNDTTRLMVEGSTGGAGLRALQTEEPTPIEASVLYLDRTTRRLQAWDDVTLGGLGQTSAQISRHRADEKDAGVTAGASTPRAGAYAGARTPGVPPSGPALAPARVPPSGPALAPPGATEPAGQVAPRR